MAKTLLESCSTPVAAAAGATDYWALGTANLLNNATEVNRQIVFRSAGVLSNMIARITANATTGGTNTIKTRNSTGSGGNGVQVVNPGTNAGAVGEFEDSTHSDTVTAADKLNYQSTVGSGGTLTIGILSCIFAATTDSVSILVSNGAGSYTSASVSRYNHLAGENSGAVGLESSCLTKIRKAGVLKYMQVYVSANARTASTMNSRKNSGAGALTLNIGASSGAILVEDTTHSDTLDAGNNSDYEMVLGTGTSTMTVQIMKSEFVTTTGNGMLVSARPGAYAQAKSTTSYFGLGGNMVIGATESQKQTKARFAFTLSEFTVTTTANGLSGQTDFRTRVDGGDGAQLVSFAGGAFATTSDSTHTDVLTGTEQVNESSVAGTGSGSVTITIRGTMISTFIADLTRVTNANTLLYNIRSQVTHFNTLKYNMQSRVVHADTLLYNLRKQVTKSNTLRYSLLQQIVSAITLLWNIANAELIRVASAYTLKYNLEQRITQSNTLRYNTLYQVLKASTLKYSLFQLLSKSNTVKYSVLKQILSANTLRYNLLQPVSNSRTLRYNLYTLVLKSNTLKYSLLAQVLASATLLWNIVGGQLTRVSNAYTLKYNMQQRLTHANTIKYDVMQLITNSNTIKYSLLQGLAKSATLKYNLLVSIAKSNTIRYDIYQLITKADTLLYNIVALARTYFARSTNTHVGNLSSVNLDYEVTTEGS